MGTGGCFVVLLVHLEVCISPCGHLRQMGDCEHLARSAYFGHKRGHTIGHVRIINSGIGAFALLYALVNKQSEIYAFESNSSDYKIAQSTAILPKNLHYIHAVWTSELDNMEPYDLTIILDSYGQRGSSINTIYLPLKT